MENFLIPLNEALLFGENVYTIYHIRFAFLQNFESEVFIHTYGSPKVRCGYCKIFIIWCKGFLFGEEKDVWCKLFKIWCKTLNV